MEWLSCACLIYGSGLMLEPSNKLLVLVTVSGFSCRAKIRIIEY